MFVSLQRILASILCSSILVISCQNHQQASKDNMHVVTDMLGRQVEVPKDVQRVLGLRAGSLRMLSYMDVAHKVVGIEEAEKRSMRPYLLAYPSLKELPIIGPNMGGDAELILKSHPDLIFSSYTTVGDADALQKKTGIPVVAIDCPEFGTERERLFASMELIGQVMGKERRADSLIRFINESIEELDLRTTKLVEQESPNVYVGGISYRGAHGINSTQPYFPPFLFANAFNVASEIDERLVSHVKGTYVDIEQLLVWNPEVVFIDESGLNNVYQDLANNPIIAKQVNAFKQNRVYSLWPHNNYATNYEYVLVNAWIVGKLLYPEAFEDVDIKKKSLEVLKNFYLGSDTENFVKSTYSLELIELNLDAR